MVGMGLPRVSELVVDADLTIPEAYTIYARAITALSGGNLALCDNLGNNQADARPTGLYLNGPSVLYANFIREKNAGTRVVFPNGIRTDTINDNGAPVITVLEDLELDAGKYIKAASAQVDTITDRAYSGMPSFPYGLKADHIAEYTSAHGIVFDDTVTLDSLITLLTQRYRTAAAGATSRYASADEVFISNPGATPTQIKSSVTIPAWYSGATNTFSITFEGKSSAISAGDEMYLTVNNVEVGTRLSLTDSGYSIKNQNIGTLKAGDVIKIMCVDTVGTGGNLYCRKFEILSTDTVSLPISTETW